MPTLRPGQTPDSVEPTRTARPTPPERQCDDCGDTIPDDEDGSETHDSRHICDACASDYERCEDCGDLYSNGDMNGIYCRDCASNHQDDYDDNGLRGRAWYSGGTYKDAERAGAPLQSMRPFGIELELLTKDYGRANKISKELPQHIGIHSDGSINGSGVGMEIVTPVMNGIKAVNLVNKMCEKIKEHGGNVNKSCGYHIHVDMSDLDNDTGDRMHRKLRDLWLMYIAFEDVIMSFLPPSRRNNRYCKVLRSDYNFMEIYGTKNAEQLEKIWYRVSTQREVSNRKASHKDDSRYRGINMHTLFSERHIEIRYHSGTINARKILEWANLHLMIADTAFFKGVDISILLAMTNEINIAEKTSLFFKLLQLDPKSEGYFRARQAHFMKASAIKEPSESDRKEVADLLAVETEQ